MTIEQQMAEWSQRAERLKADPNVARRGRAAFAEKMAKAYADHGRTEDAKAATEHAKILRAAAK